MIAMKTFNLIGTACLTVILCLSSCVSNKKYEATINGWQKNYDAVYKAYAKAVKENKDMKDAAVLDPPKNSIAETHVEGE
jgi:hypothetical protein